MRTADPALNPSAAAARRWLPRRPGSPSQPPATRCHAGEAGRQDGAEPAEPSPFPALAPKGRRVLPGVSVMQHGRPGKPCRAAGTSSRAAPTMAVPRRHAGRLRDSPTHTQPDTCTRTTLSLGDTHADRDGRAGRDGQGAMQQTQLRLPGEAHTCSRLQPRSHALRRHGLVPRQAGPRQPAGLPCQRSCGRSLDAACTPRAQAARPRQARRHVSSRQPASPPHLPASPRWQGGARHPGVTRRGPARGRWLPCAPQSDGDVLPRASPAAGGQGAGPGRAQEAFWHFGLACRCCQQP